MTNSETTATTVQTYSESDSYYIQQLASDFRLFFGFVIILTVVAFLWQVLSRWFFGNC